MLSSILLSTISLLTLTTALPTLNTRNSATDPFTLTWWENGCNVDGTSNAQTYIFNTDPSSAQSKPGECIPTPLYNWQSVQIKQDSSKSYIVDLYSGEGCNNFITTVSEDRCYTQPEGQMVLSARVRLA